MTTGNHTIKKILVLDGNPPWVRSLLHAVSRKGVIVRALRPHSASVAVRCPGLFSKLCKWTSGPENYLERHALFMGWTRFPRISTAMILHAARRAIADMGGADAVIFNLPQYARVAARIEAPMIAYHAYDPYLSYDWDQKMIADLERQIVNRANIVFSVAEALSEDFRPQTRTPVVTLRNAVSQTFVARMGDSLPMPRDLAAFSRPIVGCTGQINHSYDWSAIVAIAGLCPEMSFMFVGPVIESEGESLAAIERAKRVPNIRFLGAKPHEELPAYLQAFDVCLNPLKPTAPNNRRSPLRLYDYLATTKPILSTSVREAYTHGSLVEVFKTPEEAAAMLRAMIAPDYRVDLQARAAYLELNTWDARADEFLCHLRQSATGKIAQPIPAT